MEGNHLLSAYPSQTVRTLCMERAPIYCKIQTVVFLCELHRMEANSKRYPFETPVWQPFGSIFEDDGHDNRQRSSPCLLTLYVSLSRKAQQRDKDQTNYHESSSVDSILDDNRLYCVFTRMRLWIWSKSSGHSGLLDQ